MTTATISGHISGASSAFTWTLTATEISVDTASNTSTVRSQISYTKSSGAHANDTKNVYATINGVTHTWSMNAAGTGTGASSSTWDDVITHNSDGTKSITITLDATAVSWYVATSTNPVSKSMTLTAIDVAPHNDKIKYSGAWREHTDKIKYSGAWRDFEEYVKYDGAWYEVGD